MYVSHSYVNFLYWKYIYCIKHLTCVQVVSVGGKSEGEAQKNSLCVNSGRLARGEGWGFFLELNYHGSLDSATAYVIRI